jgi:hypothetical protein
LFFIGKVLFRKQMRTPDEKCPILCCHHYNAGLFFTITLSQIALNTSLAAGFFVMNQ